MNVLRVFALIALCAASLLAEKFPSQVKKSVTFIFAKDTANRLSVQGTGFFVLMKDQHNADTATFGYLVTTKSALKKANGQYLDTIYVRINRKDGYSDTLIVPLTADAAKRFFVHPDSTVDLAVIPAFPDVNRYDVLYIPTGLIGSVDVFEREGITEGSELFSIGMLTPHIGIFKNIPLVQFGRIVQMSPEKYRWGNAFTEFFLMETDAAFGVTGAPVYYYAEAVKDTVAGAKSARLFLSGILAGPYQFGASRVDLARVIPAYKLSELLNTAPVAGEREKEIGRMKKESVK
jgi:hypothetical protein